MAIESFGIPLAYAVVTSLLLWMLLSVKVRWWIKAAVIFLCLYYALGLWGSLRSLQGWPVEAEMPARFEIVWVDTEEPDKKTGRSGEIYIWAKDLAPPSSRGKPFFLRFGPVTAASEPRIYRLPYSRPLHEQAETIRQKISAGRPFFGYFGKAGIGEGRPVSGRPGKGPPGKGGGPEGEGGEVERPALSSYASRQELIFHELPPPRLPEKSLPE